MSNGTTPKSQHRSEDLSWLCFYVLQSVVMLFCMYYKVILCQINKSWLRSPQSILMLPRLALSWPIYSLGNSTMLHIQLNNLWGPYINIHWNKFFCCLHKLFCVIIDLLLTICYWTKLAQKCHDILHGPNTKLLFTAYITSPLGNRLFIKE